MDNGRYKVGLINKGITRDKRDWWDWSLGNVYDRREGHCERREKEEGPER